MASFGDQYSDLKGGFADAKFKVSNSKLLPALVQRWQLAVKGRIAHVITMPHISRDRVDQLVASLAHCTEEVHAS